MPIEYQLPDFDIKAFFKEVHEAVEKSTKKHLENKARKITKQVAENIRLQDFNPILKPLAESTLNQKEGSDLLIDSGAYVDAIASKANDNEVSVYLNEIAHPKGRGKSITDIATILEYGTNDGHVPARPHWRPVYAQVLADQEKDKERIKKAAQRSAAKAMSKFTKEQVIIDEDTGVDLDDMTWEQREAYDKAQMEKASKQAVSNVRKTHEENKDTRTKKERKAALKEAMAKEAAAYKAKLAQEKKIGMEKRRKAKKDLNE